jgi:hypothetical protein
MNAARRLLAWLLALHFSFKLLGLQLLGQADELLDVVLRLI